MSFLELYGKFTTGLDWINRKRNAGIDVSADEARFEAEVAIPLDLEWMNLSDAEKDQFIEDKF